MRVHIVAPDMPRDSVIYRLAQTLADHTDWTLSTRPRPDVDLNYSMLYIDWCQRFTDWKATPWAAYFSHLETGTTYKEFWWQMGNDGMRIKTVTALQYGALLSGHVIHTPAPIDPMYAIRERTQVKLPVIGISGFTDRSGRKGEKLLATLAAEMDGKARLIASGKGWPVETKLHKMSELPAFYNSLDLYVCTSLIEGVPMPPLEALACGVPVVIPQGVGMLDELPSGPGVWRYPKGDSASFVRTVASALQSIGELDREAIRANVEGHTPEMYAQAHKAGFKAALEQPVKQQAAAIESDRHGKRGVYYVAYGEQARKCAQGAIDSFKKYFPDIPVALVSDTPLGPEDVFVYHEDYDIGGRAAKIKIYDLAPKDWQYVVYLDADTEITAHEPLLWQALEDGWDFVICKNPGRFANASQMKRSDNIDECEVTYRKVGTDEVIQLNGGVFGFTRNRRTSDFFHKWYDEWLKYGKRDQAALLRALWDYPLRTYVLGNEWNTIVRYDSPDMAAWLLHYPMTARRWRGVIHHRLNDPGAWEAVKEFEMSQGRK